MPVKQAVNTQSSRGETNYSKIMEVKAKSYTLTKNNGWLGQVVITTDGFFAAVTDYGSFSYTWRCFGEMDFRAFLSTLDAGYFSGKMVTGMAYIVYNNRVKEAAKRFTAEVLPVLQEVLKQDLKENPKFY